MYSTIKGSVFKSTVLQRQLVYYLFNGEEVCHNWVCWVNNRNWIRGVYGNWVISVCIGTWLCILLVQPTRHHLRPHVLLVCAFPPTSIHMGFQYTTRIQSSLWGCSLTCGCHPSPNAMGWLTNVNTPLLLVCQYGQLELVRCRHIGHMWPQLGNVRSCGQTWSVYTLPIPSTKS